MDTVLAKKMLQEASPELIQQYLGADVFWRGKNDARALPPKFARRFDKRAQANSEWGTLSKDEKRRFWADEVKNVVAFAQYAQGGALSRADLGKLAMYRRQPQCSWVRAFIVYWW